MDFLNIIGTLFDNSINHVVAIANLIKDLRLNKNQQDINEDLYELISISKNTKEKCKGYFDNISELTQYISSPEVGDWAIVRDLITGKCYIYNCINKGIWHNTEQEYETPEIDIINYPRKTDFKTINNLSIIGEGNIEIFRGEDGSPGVDGKSAYELAVLQGYSGTLTEWLNSLVGPQGVQGILGIPGEGFEIYGEYDSVQAMNLDASNVPIGKFVVINAEGNQDDSKIYLRTSNLTSYPTGYKFLFSIEDVRVIKGERGPLGVLGIQGIQGPKGDAFTYEDFTQELLSNLITLIENNIKNKDKVNHIFLTQVEYNALTTYEKDTLYIIVEHESSGGSSFSSFGDTFPFVLGSPVEPTLLGGKFPITLD